MKIFNKTFSIVLALVMMISTFAFSASAKTVPGNEFKDGRLPGKVVIESEKVNSEPDVYKFTVSTTCSLPTITWGYCIYFDRTVWKLVSTDGTPDSDPYDSSDYGVELLGQMADKSKNIKKSDTSKIPAEHASDFTKETGIYGLGTTDFSTTLLSDDNYDDVDVSQFASLSKEQYGAIRISWRLNATRESLNFLATGDDGRDARMFSFCLQVKEGAELTEENAEVGQIEGGMDWTLDYPVNGSLSSKGVGSNLSKANITVVNANPAVTEPVVTSGPKVVREKAQIKMTPIDAGHVADEFQFRVLSKISNDDWNTYLANTGKSEDTNCVTKLGFVAYKGTDGFDMEAAKAAAKAGVTQGNYYVATTNYIKHTDGSDAEFAARIDTTKTSCDDATYIAFIQYKDADGTEQYAFYDAEYTALIKTNYDLLVSQYLGQFPFVG